MTLDPTTARTLKGAALALAVAAALVGLYLILSPSEADIQRAAEQLGTERQPQQKRDPYFAWPQITRWHFVTKLPIPGEINRYRWEARGEFAYALDRDCDRMVNFRLVTLESDEPIELVSPLVLFDKKARTLFGEAPTQVEFSWGTVRSQRMRLDLDAVDAFFDQNVVVDVIRNEAGTGPGDTEADDSSGETGNGGDGAPPPAKKKPLRITSQHFEIRTAEDKAVFTTDVKAVDNTGTIWADTMIVEYYTDEEKQQDPSRTGMKRITCIGDVRIDQKTEQAKCEKAIYEVAANIITLLSTDTTRVLYRKDDGTDKHQVLANTVVIDRNPGGKTKFSGNVEVQDFSETRESFFGGLTADEENEAEDNGASESETEDEE